MDYYLYNKRYLLNGIKFFDVFTGNDILMTGVSFIFIIDASVVVDVELAADIPVVVDVVIEVVVAVVVDVGIEVFVAVAVDVVLVLDLSVIVVLLVLVVVSTFFIKRKII